jgi:hypothetical protein
LKISKLSNILREENPIYKEIKKKIDHDDLSERKKVKKKERFCLESTH